jgi:hypothetical protein
MKNYILITFIFLIFSCNQKSDDKVIPVNMTDTIVTEQDKVKEINKQVGDTIKLLYKNEKGSYIAEGSIDSIHPRIYVKFTNDDIGSVKATLKPVGLGNIRFNQIIFPDETGDGPFGQDLEHQLNQTGEHTLIIGHSLMAENPYQGKFKVELQLTEE